MSVVKGKNVVFTHQGKPVACIRTYSDTSSVTVIETTTVGDGINATFKPQKNTNTASLEGVQLLKDATKWTYPELKKAALLHTYYEGVTVVSTDEAGNMTYEFFNMYIVGISRTGAVGDFATFQMDLQISGAVVIVVDPDFALLFTTGTITSSSFQIITSFTSGVTWDLSLDGGATFPVTGLTSTSYTVTGLTTGTTYQVVRRIHSLNGDITVLPAVAVTTL